MNKEMFKVSLRDCTKTNDISYVLLQSHRINGCSYGRTDYELVDYRKNYLIFKSSNIAKKPIALEFTHSSIIKAIINYNKKQIRIGYSTLSADEVQGMLNMAKENSWY